MEKPDNSKLSRHNGFRRNNFARRDVMKVRCEPSSIRMLARSLKPLKCASTTAVLRKTYGWRNGPDETELLVAAATVVGGGIETDTEATIGFSEASSELSGCKLEWWALEQYLQRNFDGQSFKLVWDPSKQFKHSFFTFATLSRSVAFPTVVHWVA